MDDDITMLRPNVFKQDMKFINRVGLGVEGFLFANPPAFVWKASDVTIHGHGGVQRNDGKMVWDGLISRAAQELDHAPVLDTKTKLSTSCGFVGHSENFGHTIFEGLTRVAVLELAGHGDLPIAVWEGSRLPELLSLIGKESFTVTAPCHFENVVIPSCPVGRNRANEPYGWADAIWWIRMRFAHLTRPGDRLIYLRRTGAKHRNVLNDTEVCEALTAIGFECLDISGLPVEEQISVVASAQILIIAGGAASPMAAFANGVVIELAPPVARGVFGVLIFAMAYGLPFMRVECVPTGPGINADYSVDIGDLIKSVRQVLA